MIKLIFFFQLNREIDFLLKSHEEFKRLEIKKKTEENYHFLVDIVIWKLNLIGEFEIGNHRMNAYVESIV